MRMGRVWERRLIVSKGLGVYVNKDCLTDASNNVFVNIFPTGTFSLPLLTSLPVTRRAGKCTVTAASSLQHAEEVARVIGDVSLSPHQSRRPDLLGCS